MSAGGSCDTLVSGVKFLGTNAMGDQQNMDDLDALIQAYRLEIQLKIIHILNMKLNYILPFLAWLRHSRERSRPCKRLLKSLTTSLVKILSLKAPLLVSRHGSVCN